ncbi:MAG: carboxypeptidase regulatory-like domain-containing protein, partial [Acidobacteriaceae bacterium]|nr:carboxypeptidase regulatory-like domain-containing protein [Acidobacteriaceae bacterium]
MATAAAAQIATSSLTGTVLDPQGHRVPNAIVTAFEKSTGLERKSVTTLDGTYFLDSLPIGLYSISFAKTGFADYRVDGVEQTVGHTHTLDAKLSLAKGTAQQVSVTEPLIQLERSNATIGAPVEQAQVNELPLNGRNWASLTALTPGAIDNGPSDQRTIRFAGHGLDDNNLTLDGVDATAIYNQEQREYVRLAIPLGSIDEFQVQSQNFAANVEGGTAGGQVAVASRSGTNSFHGSAFDYFRNDALDARTPFDKASPDPFLLNQFGADFGGPIDPNKTFFYVNYEGLRQRLGQTQIGLVPSPSFVA